MLFNSWIFIAALLPATLILCHGAWRLRMPRLALLVLLGASVVFYAAWDPRFAALLAGLTLLNYALAALIDRAPPGPRRRLGLGLGVAVNLAVLFWFKYAAFAATLLPGLAAQALPLAAALPLGISFFTFQKIAYLADTHAERRPPGGLLDFALFVWFFPQLIAGPIVHHREVMPQFLRKAAGATGQDLVVGLSIFVLGLAKKVLLADGLAQVATPVFDAAAAGSVPHLGAAWLAALAYALQIYFDFSGYSDMAVGIARMFGIDLPVNFASPYRATSIIEFWRRWHITLSRFLRDYLYIRLGGGRRGATRRLLNVFVTMLIGGVWHGAGWTFVLWGALHGAMIVANHLWRLGASRRVVPSGLGWALTFLLVLLAWIPFRSADLATAGRMALGLVGGGGVPDLPGITDLVRLRHEAIAYAIGLGRPDAVNPLAALVAVPVAAFVVMAMPNVQALMGAAAPGLRSPGYPDPAVDGAGAFAGIRWRPDRRWATLLALLFAVCLLKLNDVSEFIYFNF